MDTKLNFQISVSRKTKHDLRTPLNQIIGYSELLQEEIGEAGHAGWVSDLEKIREAANAMVHDLDRLFDPEQPQECGFDMGEDYGAPEGDAASQNLSSNISQEVSPDASIDMSVVDTPTRPSLCSESANFLVVDDSDKNREILCRRLRQHGYEVQAAADGYEALEMIERESFDIVLLDVVMPGMSGYEVLRKIREKHASSALPVIMATAKDQPTDVIEALHMGANDYVTKPLNFPILLARAQTHLSIKRLSQLKDEFMQIASHDLKNPVMAIMGGVSLLRARHPESVQLTDIIQRSAKSIQTIISSFLDFRVLEDGRADMEVKPVDLNAVATQAAQCNAHYAVNKGIEVSTELDPAAPAVCGDPVWIEQVVQNMVGNAIKFGHAEDKVVIRSKFEAPWVGIEVIDSGPGLTGADLTKLFTKYAKLSNKPTGGEKSSGLGLSICRQIIELHKGQIGARNNEGAGSTFWFRLPAMTPSEVSPAGS